MGRRFPIGLTISTAIVFAILCGLGGWQLQRRAWKQDLLARIEATRTTPAQPAAAVLARAAKGADVDFSRVYTTCRPAGFAPSKVYLYGLVDGRPVWRNLAPCLVDSVVVIVDRGYAGTPEATRPPKAAPAAPQSVIGILRKPDQPTGIQKAVTYAQNDEIGWQVRQNAMAAAAPEGLPVSDLILVAESESPSAEGLTPAPLPAYIPNRHLEYALTWFGLAGALAAVYAALLRRRLKAA